MTPDPHTGSKAKWNRLVRKYRTVPTEDERMSRMLDALFPDTTHALGDFSIQSPKEAPAAQKAPGNE
jgi:hypothetical protein